MIIPIFFSVDDSYVPYLSVALTSLLENASPLHEYHIHILHQGVSPENQRRILALSRSNSKIEFNTIDWALESIRPDCSGNELASLQIFTLTIFFRIFIPEIFRGYDKGIYLDSDICVPGDISKLFLTDLGGKLIGACSDSSISGVKPITDYTVEAVGVDRKEDYINSGVLLMDMRRLRELHFAERFLYLNAKYNFDSIAPDQDYINAMCKGRIHYLDPVWDAMPNDSLPPLEHPAIIHYNLFEKPWAKDDVQYGEYFWHYARNSEYYAQIVEVKNSLTASDLEMAGARFSRMTERAVQISRSEGRFSDIFGSGAEHRL